MRTSNGYQGFYLGVSDLEDVNLNEVSHYCQTRETRRLRQSGSPRRWESSTDLDYYS